MEVKFVPTHFVQNSFIKCTKGSQLAIMCKSICFKDLLAQDQKLYGKTEYSFGKFCEQHLLAAYTFAVTASRLLGYKKIEILLNIFLTVSIRAIKCNLIKCHTQGI
jgi:hypothetical protein